MHPLDERLNRLITGLHSHAEEATSLSMRLRARGGQAMAATLLAEVADIVRTLDRLRPVAEVLDGDALDAVVGGRIHVDAVPARVRS